MLHLGKRIHPAPPATADLTDDPAAVSRRGPGAGCRRPRGFEPGAGDRRRTQIHTGRSTQGRLICHAALSAARSALARAGGRDDRHAPRRSVDSGGWPRGAGDGGIFPGNGDGNNAGRGHSEGRDKTPRHREESDTRAGEKLRNKQPAPVSRKGTGQPATIMAG